MILLSDALEVPTLDNLWNYLSHFYEKVTPARKEQFYTSCVLLLFYTTQEVYTNLGIVSRSKSPLRSTLAVAPG